MKPKSKFLINIFTLIALFISLPGNGTTTAHAAENLAASGTWSGLSGLVAGPVNAIATSGTDVYVGGSFNNVAGNVNAKNIAKWDGSAWSALGTGLNGSVKSIAIRGTDVYVGGTFTDAGGDVNADSFAKWDGSAWSAVGTGSGFYGGSRVDAIAVSGNNIYAGGWFNFSNGDPRQGIMKWDGSTWSALGTGLPDNLSGVNAIAINGADVYIGGTFADAGGNANADNIAKWNGSTWTGLGTGVNGSVRSIGFSAGNVYIGGTFTDAGGDTNADHIAKWNGSTWSALGNGLNNNVFSMAVSGTDIYAGGDFTDTAHIAKWDGFAWSALGTGTNGAVNALAVNRGDLYAGGMFSDAGGAPNTFFIARYEVTGATINVNTALNVINNDGNCSLSEAIQSANTNSGVDACTSGLGPDTILFSAALGPATIMLPADLPDMADAYGLTINGGGDITINGGGLYHPFMVPTGMSLTLDGITVINGKSGADYGGAVTNYYGQLTILNSTFTNNSAPASGAVDNNSGVLVIANSTFSGNSATTLDAGAVGSDGGRATITNSNFSNNSAPSTGAVGIISGAMEITNSSFSGNQATTNSGGAIVNSASLTIANSTFSGNTAPYYGGAIGNTGNLVIANSTLSGNSANLGGGIFNVDKLDLTNTILANSPTGGDCFNYSSGTVTGLHDIIETDSAGVEACGTTSPLNVDPQIGALANNGGSTPTFSLLAGSPAINAGTNTGCPATDQRGVARPQGAQCDIGAYELEDSISPDTSIDSHPANPTLSNSASFAFSGTDGGSGVASFECQLDGGSYAACTSPANYLSLTASSHTFNVRAVDLLGNLDASPATFSWLIQAERTTNGGLNTYLGPSKIPTNWVAKNFATTDGKFTTAKKEGTASVKIVGLKGKSKTLTQTITLSGNAGDAFAFSFWAKGAAVPAAGVCKADVILSNGATVVMTKTVLCGALTSAFKQKTLSFTATSTYTKVVIKFTYNKASGTVWFDAVSLIK